MNKIEPDLNLISEVEILMPKIAPFAAHNVSAYLTGYQQCIAWANKDEESYKENLKWFKYYEYILTYFLHKLKTFQKTYVEIRSELENDKGLEELEIKYWGKALRIRSQIV